jgi:hypothetical protein
LCTSARETYPGSVTAPQHSGLSLSVRENQDEVLHRLLDICSVQFLTTTIGRCDVVGTIVCSGPTEVVEAMDHI